MNHSNVSERKSEKKMHKPPFIVLKQWIMSSLFWLINEKINSRCIKQSNYRSSPYWYEINLVYIKTIYYVRSVFNQWLRITLMNEIDSIPIHHSYYLKWKQVYNNYVTSDIKPQPIHSFSPSWILQWLAILSVFLSAGLLDYDYQPYILLRF
jgi:hypothetical protein